MSTKNDLIVNLSTLGWEAINVAKTLKLKYEQAINALNKGGEPDAKLFRKLQTSTTVEVPVSTTVEVPAPVENETPVEASVKVEAPKQNVKKTAKKTETKFTEVKFPTPEVKVPETKVPETKVPETKVPETKVPETKVPETLPKPQQRVEKEILKGTVTIKSEALLSILDAASSLSSADYTDILIKLSSFCGTANTAGNAVTVTRNQISDVTVKNLELTKEEYLLFKKHYTANCSSPQVITEKSGLDISKVCAAMFNNPKYASAYRT